MLMEDNATVEVTEGFDIIGELEDDGIGIDDCIGTFDRFEFDKKTPAITIITTDIHAKTNSPLPRLFLLPELLVGGLPTGVPLLELGA